MMKFNDAVKMLNDGHTVIEGAVWTLAKDVSPSTQQIVELIMGWVGGEFIQSRSNPADILIRPMQARPKRSGMHLRARCYGERDWGDSWLNWVLFPADLVPSDDEELLDRLGWYGWNSECPGRSYGRRPYVRRTRTRVLVTHEVGLDI